MTNKEIDRLMPAFVDKFNAMCRAEKVDFLTRQYTQTFESGQRTYTVRVIYQVKKKGKGVWQVEAIEDRRGWFKKRFPLFRITRTAEHLILSGLFLKATWKFAPTELGQKLVDYLEICKQQPKDAFTQI